MLDWDFFEKGGGAGAGGSKQPYPTGKFLKNLLIKMQ